MVFLQVRREPGVPSRVTAGVAFNNFCISAMSGIPFSPDGHLRSLNYGWQNNTDASGGEAGGRCLLSS